MATVFDVAAYIVEKKSPMTTFKLQKLVYYSQAWSLVWDEKPIFEEEIQAWANGPVVYELFDYYRGRYGISEKPEMGDVGELNDTEIETIDIVLATYGDLSGRSLSQLTHSEDPWKIARGNIPDTEISNNSITLASMAEYYSALDTAEEAVDVGDLNWIWSE